ncbi:leukocyte elastase inhibitor-like isoform X1 [Toxotes jaculatrix]|uniref:leukocyte elastase inhibitor-like isoform X1 n=1 Tax=Toxotes jaculatrix TaxID=941984 RepID=UPI001B3AB574|nr:leukocyte elastase inhibitor-like isoform X1 [Toxotes jaculatrix]
MASSSSSSSSVPLSKANITFCLDLFQKLNDNKTANIFFSPFSISSALAMVTLGARGNTAKQISECLKTQDCQDEVHTGFAQLLSELNKADAPYALSVANRLYGEQSFQFIEDFLTQTRTHYNAELEAVDFKISSEAARVKINNWVEEKTKGKIKDIVAEGDMDRMTRLVLVNALYFKGTWNKTFNCARTEDADFKLNKRETKLVKMMTQDAYFPLRFIPEIDCQILEMPYKEKELSMLIFLPKEIQDDTTGLEKLEKQLTYEKFVEWTRPDMMPEAKVDVSLPRFKMEETYDLNNVLKNMGIVDAFDVLKSDFSGMSEARDLFLSKVSHKAFVEVNEEGTEAAAATAVFCQFESGCLKKKYFTADHPFLFFIRHNPTMSVLFAGRFCSPV